MSREKSRYNTSEIDVISVPFESTEVVSADSPPYNRTYIVLRNLSDTINVWLAVNIDAESGKGILLKPGDSWELHADNMTAAAINAISHNLASTAEVTVFIGKL